MNSPENQVYLFEDVEVDTLRGYLKCGGEERHLRQKTFQVLAYLLEHRGSVVTKDELMNEIWKDTAVIDDVLVQSIKDIRRALGDNTHHPRFIKTIPKSGYRFIGEVRDSPSSVVLSPSQKQPATDKGQKTKDNGRRTILLSIKLANRLNAGEMDLEKSKGLAEMMTKNLEAYRYYSLGVEQAQALHNTEAIALFEKAIALDQEFAMAHARIGYAYAVTWNLKEKGKPYLKRAFQLSERLTGKDRLNIAAWYAIANLDFQNAAEQFRRIIAKYPLEIEAYYQLARLLQDEGQTEEAVNILKQGLAIDPEAKNLYNGLGGILSFRGRHAEAIAAHRRYVALAQNEPNAFDSLGMTYQWAGDYELAIANYNRALELNPNFIIAAISG